MDCNKTDINEFHWITVLLQSIDAGIVVLDRNYNIQVWNCFMENHSGIRPDNVRDKNLFELFPDIPEGWFKQKAEPVFTLNTRAFSTWQQRPYLFKFKNYRPITGSADYMYQDLTIVPITSLSGSVDSIAAIIYDVTDVATSEQALQEANAILLQKNRIDALTQLNNRGHWEECLRQEFDRYKRYKNPGSLVMFDIDHFKQINDTYGHQAGDEVLRNVAKVLNDSVRTTDIAGRYGGEEFGVILINTPLENTMHFTERLRTSIEKTISKHGNKDIKVTISLGVAEFNNEQNKYEALISQADDALYTAKNQGRNCTSIYSYDETVKKLNTG